VRISSVLLSLLHVQFTDRSTPMNNPISPLRQRMIDDMTFRNMSPSTHKVYTYAVANFSTFHGRSPDKLGIEDVRKYRLRCLRETSHNILHTEERGEPLDGSNEFQELLRDGVRGQHRPTVGRTSL
jgi:hypothetical protein